MSLRSTSTGRGAVSAQRPEKMKSKTSRGEKENHCRSHQLVLGYVFITFDVGYFVVSAKLGCGVGKRTSNQLRYDCPHLEFKPSCRAKKGNPLSAVRARGEMRIPIYIRLSGSLSMRQVKSEKISKMQGRRKTAPNTYNRKK